MTVELDETMFRIVADDGTASELATYGTAAMMEYEGERFYCWADGNEPENEPPAIFRIDTQTEIEASAADVEFEVSAEGDDEEDEDDDEGGVLVGAEETTE